LIENISKLCDAGRKAYRVTGRGKEIAKLLRSAEKDYDEITKQKENKDPYVILDETKRRGKTSGNRELKGHISGPTALNTLKIERMG
jgi:collagenase-like PrtC family protease